MQSDNYLHWDIDPIVFSIPEFSLPFSISILGLVFAAVIFYFGYQQIKPKGRKGEVIEPDAWKVYGLIAVSVIIGQLPFLIIDSPSFNSLGPIEPRWYGLMFASAFFFGYLLEFKFFKDAGRPQEDLDRLLIYVLIATIIGARLGHVIFYELEFYLRNIHLVPQVWTGGLASHGAAIGIIIAMYLYAKKTTGATFMWVADRVVPAVAVGGIFIRIGNFFNSEIIGNPTELPWAVVFERIDMLPRHPSMLYESLLCVLVLAVLLWIYKKYDNKPPEGALFGTFLVMLFTGRFLIEFTKITMADFMAGSLFDMGQLLSIPFVLFGAWLLWKKVKWNKPAKR